MFTAALFVRVVHQSVESVGKEFYELLRRRVWVTPMSYLELLGSFKRQLERKRADVGRNRSRLQVGSTVRHTVDELMRYRYSSQGLFFLCMLKYRRFKILL